MNNGRKDKKAIRYLKVKDGNISVEYTNDLIQAMKEEYEYFFDTSDHLFDRYEDTDLIHELLEGMYAELPEKKAKKAK